MEKFITKMNRLTRFIIELSRSLCRSASHCDIPGDFLIMNFEKPENVAAGEYSFNPLVPGGDSRAATCFHTVI